MDRNRQKKEKKVQSRVLARVLAEDLRNVETGLDVENFGDRPTTPFTSRFDTTV